MKTIKELENEYKSDNYERSWKYRLRREIKILKDVLGLIDEHLNNPANCTTACMQELKARISGI